MHKKCEINRTKIKGGCQSGSKMVTHDSKSDLPLEKRDRKKTTMSFSHLGKMCKLIPKLELSTEKKERSRLQIEPQFFKRLLCKNNL